MRVKERIQGILADRIMIGDGAIGTLLQMRGLAPGHPPEVMLLDRPEEVAAVHRLYVEAGADMLTTNTFGASRPKLAQHGLAEHLETINRKAVQVARDACAGKAFVAASVGPTGDLLQPMGTMTIPELVLIYREQIRILKQAGADFAILETISDVGELQAAARACYLEKLPFMASMTFNEAGRSLSGSTPEIAAITIEPYSPLAVGTNCGLGPREMAKRVMEYAAATDSPVIAQPNAGLPELVGRETVFNLTPDEFAAQSIALVAAGAAIVGGCCGTTPEHIAVLRRAVEKYSPRQCEAITHVRFAARSGIAIAGINAPFCVIGERINPTGRKILSRQLTQNDLSGVRKDASLQVERGANLLDVNVGVPDMNEPDLMQRVVNEIQGLLPGTPLSIDSNDPGTLAAGLQHVVGRPLLNSINGSIERMNQLLPLVAENGANFIALAMDETGMPTTLDERMTIVRRIIREAEKHGINRNRILVDALVFTVASQPEQSRETLATVRRVGEELGCATVLGVSNISFGLPGRDVTTSSFLAMAMTCGLTAGIVNPLSDRIMETIRATELLLNQDKGATRYVTFMEERAKRMPETKSTHVGPKKPVEQHGAMTELKTNSVFQAMMEGDKQGLVSAIDTLLSGGRLPGGILAEELAPAIQEVGNRYGCGTIFLPQLILAAEAMRLGVAHIRPMLTEQHEKGLHGTPLVIGTVEGDIHDIGKNIVSIVLENQGFRIIDLGKNVSSERFAAAVCEAKAPVVALSALMTTTMPAMEATVRLLRVKCPETRVMVGGAVVTQAFADRIGADGYAKEAVSAGKMAKKLVGLSEL